MTTSKFKALKAWTHTIPLGRRVRPAFSILSHVLRPLKGSLQRALSNKARWLFLLELSGVVLVTYGISLWSVASAIIIGGLVLVAAIEVRPMPAPKVPKLLPPIAQLRRQAESAAMVINEQRYGLGFIEPGAVENMKAEDCERLILAARSLGAKKLCPTPV